MHSSSLERLVPDQLVDQEVTGTETFRLHMERYRFADLVIGSGLIGDIACGVGYGAFFLAARDERQVIGIDLSETAISYARHRYARTNLEFSCSDALTYTRQPAFDAIVSLETIEHVPNPRAMIAHFWQLLRPGGVLCASAPISPSVDGNPFHLHDFNERSFLKLFDGRFAIQERFFQRQPFHPLPLLTKKEVRSHDVRRNLLGFYFKQPHKAFLRLESTVRFGFCNRYLTVSLRRI